MSAFSLIAVAGHGDIDGNSAQLVRVTGQLAMQASRVVGPYANYNQRYALQHIQMLNQTAQRFNHYAQQLNVRSGFEFNPNISFDRGGIPAFPVPGMGRGGPGMGRGGFPNRGGHGGMGRHPGRPGGFDPRFQLRQEYQQLLGATYNAQQTFNYLFDRGGRWDHGQPGRDCMNPRELGFLMQEAAELVSDIGYQLP